MISDKNYLFVKTWFFSWFKYIAKCLPHNGNKHVHEYYSNKESGESKHKEGLVSIITSSVKSTVKISKGTQKVDLHDTVETIIVDIVIKEWGIIWKISEILINNIEVIGES